MEACRKWRRFGVDGGHWRADELVQRWNEESSGNIPFVWIKLLRFFIVSIFAFTISLCTQASEINAKNIVGTWRVSDVICANWEDRLPQEKGTVIELRDDRVVNPLSENCSTNPGYDLLKRVPSKFFVRQHKKTWPAIVKEQPLTEKNVLYGFITCDGGNLMQIAFLSQETALYFYEGGLLFVLKRDQKQ